MLDKESKDMLRRIRVAHHKYTECVYLQGMDCYTRDEYEDTYIANSRATLPTYDQMKEKIFNKLIEEKIRFIPVAPNRANCVIRVYRKEVEVDGKMGGVCGAVCFARNLFGAWTTVDEEGNEKKMTYDDIYEVDYWTSMITKYSSPVRASYYDVYLKVTFF